MKKERLLSALQEMQTEGVLSPDQRARVEAKLTQVFFAPTDHAGRLVTILSYLGALLVGVGILYFIAWNWEEMSKGAKLFLIFGVFLGLHFGGWVLAEKPGNYPRTGRALTCVGMLSFGGAIFLIAQIYHLKSEYPNAILLWWLLNLPFVYLTRSKLAFSIVLVLFGIWVFWHSGVFLEHQELRSWRYSWISLSLLAMGLAAFFSAVVEYLRGGPWEETCSPMESLARPLAIAGPYILSFKESWERVSAAPLPGVLFLPVAVISAAAVLLTLWNWVKNKDRKKNWDAFILLGGTAFLGVLAFAGLFETFLVANLLLFGGILLLIFKGVREQSAADINWGIAAFLLFVMTRYVEYLWDKMDAFMAFIGAGVLLLGLGFFLEKKRREWIRRSQEEQT